MKSSNLVKILIAAILIAAKLSYAEDQPAFKLKEYLGKNWQSELVYFSYDKTADIIPELVLKDQNGKEVLYQVDSTHKQIAILADLPPHSERQYHFVKAEKSLKTDITVTETNEYFELTNSRISLRIEKKLGDQTAPLREWKLLSGKWVGGTERLWKGALKQYNVAIKQKGDVFVEIECRMVFDDGDQWSQTFQLQAFEPVFSVKEAFQFKTPNASYRLYLARQGEFNSYIYRSSGNIKGKGAQGQLLYGRIPANKKASLLKVEPWLHWGGAGAATNFNLVNLKTDDIGFFGAADSICWVDPQIPKNQRAEPRTQLMADKTSIYMDFQLKRGQREYLIGSFSLKETMADLAGVPKVEKKKDELAELSKIDDSAFKLDGVKQERDKLVSKLLKTEDPLKSVDPKKLHQPLLSQKSLIKHSDFPLNRIKDYVLEWKQNNPEYPRALVTVKQLNEMRKGNFGKINGLNEHLSKYLLTGDKKEEQFLINYGTKNLDRYFHKNLDFLGPNLATGVAAHHQRGLNTAINALDGILGSKALTAKQRQDILAKLAFLGYLYSSPQYWSPERRFNGLFINMNMIVASMLCSIAAVIPEHPESKKWMNKGLDYVKSTLLSKWVDDKGEWNGAFVESPGYQQFTYDECLLTLLKAKNAGFSELLDSTAMTQMAEWFAKISTPRDCRMNNWRHIPPIANTSKFDATGAFAIFAKIYKDSDPELSARMQWMWQQQGKLVPRGTAFEGAKQLFVDTNLPAKAADYQSEWLKDSGVILRSSYDTPDETLVYMIAGKGAVPVHHYDHDQGSITIWLKGTILADDFGYCGCAPQEDHSMISSSKTNGLMLVKEFKKSPEYDYVSAKKGQWQRQLMLVKDSQKKGWPEYVVIHDSFPAPSDAVWRLWVTPKTINVHGAKLFKVEKKNAEIDIEKELDEGDAATEKSVLVGTSDVMVNGLNNVKTEIVFAGIPKGAAIKTEQKSRTTTSISDDGKGHCNRTTTQIGLIIKSNKFKNLLTLAFSFKGDKKPKITRIADGQGFKIVHSKGTDYVFLSDKEIVYNSDGVNFRGTVGVIHK